MQKEIKQKKINEVLGTNVAVPDPSKETLHTILAH